MSTPAGRIIRAIHPAIAISPSALLLDESLSSLDAKLRARLRVELRSIQKEIGIATSFSVRLPDGLRLLDRSTTPPDIGFGDAVCLELPPSKLRLFAQ